MIRFCSEICEDVSYKPEWLILEFIPCPAHFPTEDCGYHLVREFKIAEGEVSRPRGFNFAI